MTLTQLFLAPVVAFGAVALLATAAHAEEEGKLGAYEDKAIPKAAQALVDAFEMPEDKADEVVAQLKVTLGSAKFKALRDGAAVNAIFVYTIGEGGFVVKFLGGHGVIDFKGGKQGGKFKMKSTSIGAQVGGSREWGIGLVMGLTRQEHFGGVYTGSFSGAIGADEGTTLSRLERVKGDDEAKAHDVWLIGRARGLSAGVGKTKLTITMSKK